MVRIQPILNIILSYIYIIKKYYLDLKWGGPKCVRTIFTNSCGRGKTNKQTLTFTISKTHLNYLTLRNIHEGTLVDYTRDALSVEFLKV